MDTNTKKRFLAQMLANVEQLEQSSNDIGLKTESIRQYKMYVMQELRNEYAITEAEEDE